MIKSIAANFRDSHAAKSAVGALMDHGASHEQITLVLPVGEKHDSVIEEPTHGLSTTTPADAAAGATTGSVVGLGLGALAALSAITIPGVGLVLGWGVLASALGAVAASAGGGAIVGGLTGYLKDQGMSETFAVKSEEYVGAGGAMVSIVVPSGDVSEGLAATILAKYGGELHHDGDKNAGSEALAYTPIMRDHPEDHLPPEHTTDPGDIPLNPMIPPARQIL